MHICINMSDSLYVCEGSMAELFKLVVTVKHPMEMQRWEEFTLKMDWPVLHVYRFYLFLIIRQDLTN